MSYSPKLEYEHSLLPLLKQLSTSADTVTPESITSAILAISQGHCHPLQCAALLTALHYTTLDTHPRIIAAAAVALRSRGLPVKNLSVPPADKSSGIGSYRGGLVDMVGTGGDGHDTYNVSTTAAVVAAGAGLRVAKHGSKASTSSSGSADLLMALGANIMAVGPEEVGDILATGNDGAAAEHGRFCFLYAPVFHPAMKTVAEVRRELGLRTIFNVLGPIISPIDFSTVVGAAEEMPGYESRLLGVGKRGLGPVYADTLRILGVKKALVVCGDEELDEVSIAGDTHCWRLTDSSGDVVVETFRVHPTKTFGIATHSLDLCGGGGTPAENAEIFKEILDGTRKTGDPVRDFVVVNTAALLVAAGAAVGDESVGDDGVMRGTKWMDAVEKVEDAIGSGRSWNMWKRFVDMSKIAARESVNGV